MRFSITNNRGSVMNLALLMVMVLSLIVIGMSTRSTTAVQIAGNDKAQKNAFYASDSGVFACAKLVSKALSGAEDPAEPAIVFWGQGTTVSSNNRFAEELYLDQTYPPDPDPDIAFSGSNLEFSVDVRFAGRREMHGGGVEFMESYDGGGGGDFIISYSATARGTGPRASRIDLEAGYRMVPGTAGGL